MKPADEKTFIEFAQRPDHDCGGGLSPVWRLGRRLGLRLGGGVADRDGRAIITAAEPENAGVYSYDLATGDFLRLTTTAPYFRGSQPGPVSDAYVVWAEGQGRGNATQKVAEAS